MSQYPSALPGPMARLLSRGSAVPMTLGDEAGVTAPVFTPVPTPNMANGGKGAPTSSKVQVARLDAQRQQGVSPTGANEVAQGKQFSRLGDQTIFFRNGGTFPAGSQTLSPSQAKVIVSP